jgi:hypothetical protein
MSGTKSKPESRITASRFRTRRKNYPTIFIAIY